MHKALKSTGWVLGSILAAGRLSPHQVWRGQAVSLPPGVCRNLKSIVVQVGIVDYFKEPHSPEAKKMFEEMVNKLQVKDAIPRSPMRHQSHVPMGSEGKFLPTTEVLQ